MTLKTIEQVSMREMLRYAVLRYFHFRQTKNCSKRISTKFKKKSVQTSKLAKLFFFFFGRTKLLSIAHRKVPLTTILNCIYSSGAFCQHF